MTAMDDAFQAASTLGITVCVASGDNGSSDGVTDGSDHVDFPASSPFALACGGTSLKATSSAISGEVVWNDGAERRRERRRRQRFLRDAHMAGGFKRCDDSRNTRAVDEARRAGCRGRCRS